MMKFVTDDCHVYHSEWLKMHCARRGHVTTTSPEGTKMMKLMDIPLVHPNVICLAVNGQTS
jgi:hypothetical protein